MLAVMIALLGKPAGGDRPIALTDLMYKIYMKVRAPVIDGWTEEVQGPWDDAVRGSSAGSAARRRRLADEVDTALNRFVVSIYFDLAKFYDSIRIPELVDNLLELKFNPQLLRMILSMHTAPRFFRALGACSEFTCPLVSILAGCLSSNTLARGHLHKVMQVSNTAVDGVSFREYVDDVVQRVSGPHWQSLVDKSVKAASVFVNGIRDLGLQISTKASGSAVVSNCSKAADTAHRRLAAAGIPIRQQSSVMDLGTATNGGARRTTKAQKLRLASGAKRAKF
jgi:hypothetical protein